MNVAAMIHRRPSRQDMPVLFPNAPTAWWRDVVTVRPGESVFGDMVAERSICFILLGWACRSRAFADGPRQILEILLPGDHPSMEGSEASSCNEVTALNACTVARVPVAEVHAALEASAAFRGDMAAAARRRRAMLEEQLVNLGCREALPRMAHFFCEMLTRTENTEDGDRCEWPLTQTDLADAIGLSAVHTNRTLQTLRGMGLVTLGRGRLATPDFRALALQAGFTGAYLR